MFNLRRPSLVQQKNVLVPAVSDPQLVDKQESALAEVRAKIQERHEECSTLLLSASTLSRTIMSTQLEAKGWKVSCANHLTDAKTIIHEQISKEKARGFSVSRALENNADDLESKRFDAGGTRIKFADQGAVVRVVLIDSFTHEPIQHIVEELRALDEKFELRLVLVYLSVPRPVEGRGFVIQPKFLLSLAAAYEVGVDLVVPTPFGYSVVEFLTEVFLSPSGRWLRSGQNHVSASNHSRIRGLLLEVTDRSLTTHQNNDPSKEALASNGLATDKEDILILDGVRESRTRKANKAAAGPSTIDTNPEYVTLLSKYEIALRQLEVNKATITELREGQEELSKKFETTQTLYDEALKEKKQLEALMRSGGGKEGGSSYGMLVTRDAKIAQLDKENAYLKVRVDASKAEIDELQTLVAHWRQEAEQSRNSNQAMNRRFESRLRMLDSKGNWDALDAAEAEKAKELEDAVRKSAKWRNRFDVLQQRNEQWACLAMAEHDKDAVGSATNDLLRGIRNIMSRDEVEALINAKRGMAEMLGATSVSLDVPHGEGNVASATEGALLPMVSIGDFAPKEEDQSSSSSDSSDSDEDTNESSGRGKKGKDWDRFAAMNMGQLTDTTDEEVAEVMKSAMKAVQDCDKAVAQSRKQRLEAEMARREKRVDAANMARQRVSTVFGPRTRPVASGASLSAGGALSARPVAHSFVALAPPEGERSSHVSPTQEQLSPFRIDVITPQGATVQPVTMANDVAGQISGFGSDLLAELDGMVTAIEAAEKQQDTARKAVDQSVQHLCALNRRIPGHAYEESLQKLRQQLLERHAEATKVIASQPSSDQLEEALAQMAKWEVMLQDVESEQTKLEGNKRSVQHAQKRLDLEKKLDILQNRAVKLIPNVVNSKEYASYLEVQKEMILTRRELRTFGVFAGEKRGASTVEAINVIDLAEEAMAADFNTLTNASKEVTTMKSKVDLTTFPSQSGAEGGNNGRGSFQFPSRSGSVNASSARSPPDQTPSLHSVPSLPASKFHSLSKRTMLGAPTSHSSGGGGSVSPSPSSVRKIVRALKQSVQQRAEAAAKEVGDNVNNWTKVTAEDVESLVENIRAFGDLDLSRAESFFKQCDGVPTVTTLNQMILSYHKELVRLLRQLRIRTSLTSINIIDASQLQRQLLKHGKALSKSQTANIPFILAVDAAQVARFAEHFEKETTSLVTEGAARFQRYVEDAGMRSVGTSRSELQGVAEYNSRRGSSTAMSNDGGDVSVASRTSRSGFTPQTLNVAPLEQRNSRRASTVSIVPNALDGVAPVGGGPAPHASSPSTTAIHYSRDESSRRGSLLHSNGSMINPMPSFDAVRSADNSSPLLPADPNASHPTGSTLSSHDSLRGRAMSHLQSSSSPLRDPSTAVPVVVVPTAVVGEGGGSSAIHHQNPPPTIVVGNPDTVTNHSSSSAFPMSPSVVQEYPPLPIGSAMYDARRFPQPPFATEGEYRGSAPAPLVPADLSVPAELKVLLPKHQGRMTAMVSTTTFGMVPTDDQLRSSQPQQVIFVPRTPAVKHMLRAPRDALRGGIDVHSDPHRKQKEWDAAQGAALSAVPQLPQLPSRLPSRSQKL